MTRASSSLTIGQTMQTERFTLLRENQTRWKVSGRDLEGNYRRIRFDANDLGDAMKKAECILRNPNECDGKPISSNHPKLQISDALIKSVEFREWSDRSRRQDGECCKQFLQWVDQEGLTYWHELRFEHVQKYLKQLKDRNLAFDTIRLYLLPIRRTTKWMASNWPKHYANFCQDIRLSRRDMCSTQYNEERGNPYLPIHQVLDFLDWLARDEKRDKLSVGVALQGLCGLQLQEALRLTWDKVDFQKETITIDGEVKNAFRVRKIPVPSVVTWLLRKRFNQKSGLVIPGYAEYGNYSHALKRELKRWNAEVSIKPKDLRNTLQTAAIDGGWYGFYVRRYVGHAPTTIGERHYFGDQGKRMVPNYREKVISHIEREIKKWNAPNDTKIIPGPRLVVNE